MTILIEAAESGFESGHELHKICSTLLKPGGVAPKLQEYREKAAGKIDRIRQYAEHRTQLDLLYMELFDFHAETAWNAYRREQERKMMEFADLHTVAKYYAALSHKLGEETAHEINNLLTEHFACVQVMQAFRQGLLNDYMFTIANVDVETGKPVFQLWMELL